MSAKILLRFPGIPLEFHEFILPPSVYFRRAEIALDRDSHLGPTHRGFPSPYYEALSNSALILATVLAVSVSTRKTRIPAFST